MEDSNYGVAIVLGSESDLGIFNESKMTEILERNKIPYFVSIISAHRNPRELEACCQQLFSENFRVFIGVAGMAAALPGAMAAIMASHHLDCPVIGVPLPSEGFPDAQDALLSMVRMPPGMPVAVCGIGKPGLKNAALFACQMILMLSTDHDPNRTARVVLGETKEAKIGIQSSKGDTR